MDKINCTKCGHVNKTNAKYCSQCGYELPKIKIENLEEQIHQQKSSKPKKKSRIIGIIVGAIAFGLAYFTAQQFIFKTQSFDKVMMNAANELNKTCPIMVDQYTRLDNAIALPDNAFQYNYTLVNMDKSEIIIDTVKKYIEASIINNVKTNPDLKIYRDNKTTMIYNYRDKNGVFVIKISVTPDMYE